MKLLGLATVRRGGEQDELLAGLSGDAADEMVALLLAGGGARRSGARVGLVHDHQFRTLLDEDIAARLGFDEVDADDLVGVVVVNAGVALDLPVEARLRVGADDDGLEVELVADFLLPLLAEVRQADDGEAFDLAPLQKLPDDQQRLDGLADADVVGDEQTNRLLTQSHDERHHLVGARAERKLGQSAEWSGAVAERQTGRIVEQSGRADIAEIGCAWRGEAWHRPADRSRRQAADRCR